MYLRLLNFVVEVDEDIAQVMVLRPLVADILRNLVTNAIQAMPNGGKLTLKAHNAGRYVALKVCDTGIGISPRKLANIFDLFFSSKESSGFGLWSARRNALKNHGNLTVESHTGQRHHLYLAFAQNKQKNSRKTRRRWLMNRKGRVLVVDDLETVARRTRRYSPA